VDPLYGQHGDRRVIPARPRAFASASTEQVAVAIAGTFAVLVSAIIWISEDAIAAPFAAGDDLDRPLFIFCVSDAAFCGLLDGPAT
jgi:hypothetical protein